LAEIANNHRSAWADPAMARRAADAQKTRRLEAVAKITALEKNADPS
jgi:hypothetical protein